MLTTLPSTQLDRHRNLVTANFDCICILMINLLLLLLLVVLVEYMNEYCCTPHWELLNDDDDTAALVNTMGLYGARSVCREN